MNQTPTVHPRSAGRRGFTLIELILVMGLLVIVLAITSPQLSGFFGGRRAREEARRILSLTRNAQSEAISRSAQLELWIDPSSGTYGLRPYLSFENIDGLPLAWQLAEGLSFELDTQSRGNPEQTSILFLPDGTIDEASAAAIALRDKDGEILSIQRAAVGIGYEIR